MRKKFWFVFTLLLMVGFANVRFVFANEETNQLTNKGLALIQQGQWDEGLNLLKEAIAKDPKEHSLHMNYGGMLMESGKRLLSQGNATKAQETFKAAEKELSSAIELMGEDAAFSPIKSHCYFLLGDIYFYAYSQEDQAKIFYENALKVDPDNQSATKALKQYVKTVIGEKPQLHFDGRKWVKGYEKADGTQSVVEYVLEGEAVNAWSELVTVNLLFGLQQVPLSKVMENTKSIIVQSCPQTDWKNISEGTNNLIYEWEIKSCPKAEKQHEIVRLLAGNDGMWTIRYTTKKVPISDDVRQKWIELLNAVTLIEISK